MKPFFAAIGFLTVFPLPARLAGGEEEMKSMLPYFPLVGLAIGLLIAALDLGLRYVFPGSLLPSALTVLVMVAVSGGFHLDGVADSADAFMSSRGRERMLEIMKDSATGPMGVLAIVGVLFLKFSALASLPEAIRWQVIVMMPLAGRCAVVIKSPLLPYARPGGGLASIYHDQCGRRHWFLALLILAAAGGTLLGWAGIVAAASCSVVTWLFALYCRRKIGGLTGDTLGAVCELVELVPALTALALLGRI